MDRGAKEPQDTPCGGQRRKERGQELVRKGVGNGDSHLKGREEFRQVRVLGAPGTSRWTN